MFNLTVKNTNLDSSFSLKGDERALSMTAAFITKAMDINNNMFAGSEVIEGLYADGFAETDNLRFEWDFPIS